MPTPRPIIAFCPLYPPHVGGLESHAAQFNHVMAQHGHQVIVFTPHIAGGKAHETVAGVKIYRYPAWEIIPNYPLPKLWHPTFWKQYKRVKQSLRLTADGLQPVIVSRTRFFFPSCMALIFAKIHNWPLLHIEHGSDFVQLQNPITRQLAKLYDYTCGTLVLRQASAVVANSRATANFVKHLAHRTVDAVIYRGVNKHQIETIQPMDLSNSYSLPPAGGSNSLVITYVGRLISGKGVHDLLLAIYKLQITNYKLLIIGSGPERKKLEQLAQKQGIANATHFLGELPWEDTIAHIKASDIIVNPSYTEGMPSSIIEAALCQKAIIATDVGGTSEIVSAQAARLYTPRNTTQLTQHLTELTQNKKMRELLAQKAYEGVHQTFSWDSSRRAYEDLFSKLYA